MPARVLVMGNASMKSGGLPSTDAASKITNVELSMHEFLDKRLTRITARKQEGIKKPSKGCQKHERPYPNVKMI